jgi:alpha-glucosidase
VIGLLELLALVLLAQGHAYPANSGNGWQHIGRVQSVKRLPNGMELTAGRARVRITAFRDGVIRVRLAPTGTFPKDSSWAVVETGEPPHVDFRDGKAEARMTIGGVVVSVKKAPLLITFLDAGGSILLADEDALPMAWTGTNVHVWKRMPPDEMYLGLGDKAGPMNRRNRAFTMWNTDAYKWQESTDPLYKSIPFFMGLLKGTAYGVFFDNTYRSSFDFGMESADYYSFGAEGGELNYYFFAGPEPKKVIEEYTALVGRTPLPPLWALGYQQSRWSYYPEARVREIARLLREEKIPADVIYLDIDYQDGNRPFTVNRQTFPAFSQMVSDLRAQGFHLIAITDPHIKKDPDHGYGPYDSGVKADVFVKNPDGSVYVAPVWPGDSVFPDFALTRVRDWWGTLYNNFVCMGVAGFWNDMNEPAVFERADKTMPLDTLHRLDDGTALDHRALHNVYGMENARATYDGLRKLNPGERPFVLTRAAFAGTARYAATWTGDNSSTWNHLAMSTPMLLSMGISGFPLAGADVGGFVGSPPADLLTRWFELGAFYPIYRDHTANDTAAQEPWVHGPEHEAIRKRFIELRYRLLPYIYTAVETMSRTGIPLMRPILLEYPQASEFYADDRDFLFGHDLFVAPVVTEMVDAEEVRLPPGEWYDYWTSQKYTSKDRIVLHPKLDEVPLYVRAGAIIPEQPLVQNTDEKPNGPLELRVYPGDNCGGELYADDGHTFGHQDGAYLRIKYHCQVAAGSITVSSRTEHSQFQPWWTTVEVTILGAPSEPRNLVAGEQRLSGWHYDREAHAITVTLPDPGKDWTIRLNF